LRKGERGNKGDRGEEGKLIARDWRDRAILGDEREKNATMETTTTKERGKNRIQGKTEEKPGTTMSLWKQDQGKIGKREGTKSEGSRKNRRANLEGRLKKAAPPNKGKHRDFQQHLGTGRTQV